MIEWEEMAPSYTRGGLDWKGRETSSLKGLSEHWNRLPSAASDRGLPSLVHWSRTDCNNDTVLTGSREREQEMNKQWDVKMGDDLVMTSKKQ